MPGRLLAVTGGHRFDAGAFTAMVDTICDRLGWQWAHAEQPAAQRWLHPDHAGVWDAILLHDLPGLTLARGREPLAAEPGDDVRAAVLAMLAAGQGIVTTHHALAGWPSWDEWAEVLGGRFLYSAGQLRGVRLPASGYRMDTYRVDVVSPEHPVCRNVSAFDVTDELYLCPVFEHDVVPLLATTADTSPASMIDTYREVRFGERQPAADQQGSQLLGWAKEWGSSRIVYVLPGHGPSIMQHEEYRKLLTNAAAWVARR